VNEEMTLLAARQLMEIENIRHLAVTDNQNDLVKILSLADILQVIEHSYVQLLEEILEENKQILSAKDEYIQLLTNAVQQTAGMILISNRFGELEYVNQSFETISGYTLEEVKGLNPRFLKSGNISKEIYQGLWQTLLSGNTWKGELCNRTKAGNTYWVSASITPIYSEKGILSHYVAVEEDITERINMERKLRDSEQRYFEVTSTFPVMLWESDVDGKIIYFSQFWTAFTGLALMELDGIGWARLIHPDDLIKFLDDFLQSLVERKGFCVDFRLQNATGEDRWIMNTGNPHVDQKGIFVGFKGFCIDITNRKRQEFVAQ
jgi:PAS domain S-box-containing protein